MDEKKVEQGKHYRYKSYVMHFFLPEFFRGRLNSISSKQQMKVKER